eukprot:GGOE01004234.1.p1 GENE.GGOE01004234.1~~GGOE01004234.1.p1  ORF type:complete len:286 (-),score=65.48 GGOE01004234.1:718-1521(-)
MSDDDGGVPVGFSKQSRQRKWSRKKEQQKTASPRLHPHAPCHAHHPPPLDATLQCVCCTKLSLYVHEQEELQKDRILSEDEDEPPCTGPINVRRPCCDLMGCSGDSLEVRLSRLERCGADVLDAMFAFCDAVDLIICRFVCPAWWAVASGRLYFGVQEQSRTGPRLMGKIMQAQVKVATSGFRTQHDAHRFLEAQERSERRRSKRHDRTPAEVRAGYCPLVVRKGMRFFFPYVVFQKGMLTKHAVLTFGLKNCELFPVPWTAVLAPL